MSEVDIVTDVAAFEALRSEWNELVDDMQYPEIFYLWDWNYLYFRHYRPTDGLFIVVVRDRSRIVAIAPFCVTRHRRIGISVRVVEPIVINIGDYRNILIRQGHHRGNLIGLVYAALHDRGASWDVVEMAQLCTRDPTTQQAYFQAFNHPDWTVRLDVLGGIATLDLRNRTSVENAQRVRRVRNRRKTLQSRGFTIIVGSDRMEELWPFFVKLHCEAWAESPLHEERGRLFFDELRASAGLAGKFEFSFVEYQGKPVAMHFGFIDRRKVYFYMPVMDRSFNQDRVGAVLLYSMIEHYRGKHDTFDFLRGMELYKLWYTDTVDLNVRIAINRSSNLRALVHSAQHVGRDFMRGLGLPKAVSHAVKRWRRTSKSSKD